MNKIQSILGYVRNQSVSMQKRLLLYLMVQLLFALVALVGLMVAFDIFINPDKQFRQTMEIYHESTSTQIRKHLENISAKGMSLSRTLQIEMEEFLIQENIQIGDLNNQSELLLQLQEKIYPHIYTALQSMNGSGAYVIIDATTNTKLENAGYSRSGIYMRYNNINVSNPIDPYITYLRGIPEVFRKHGIEMHNRWNLEMDISKIPTYEILKQDIERENCYIWTYRIHIPSTWEEVLLLCVPIVDSKGNFMGICGFEISELYFLLSYPSFQSEFGSMFTILTPKADKRLDTSLGLQGGSEGRYPLSDGEFKIEYGNYLNTYSNESTSYVGIQRLLDLSIYDRWNVVTLISSKSYASFQFFHRLRLILVMVVFLCIILATSIFMSRKFVQPITRSLAQLQGEGEGGGSGISEIDNLAQFVIQRRESENQTQEVPNYIERLLDKFRKKLKLLSPQENLIFQYYMDGYGTEELSQLTYISLESIQKYSKNICKKLELDSMDELMLYIDLFRKYSKSNIKYREKK